MENLYTFLSIFKYYLITPIFIFDGKPPPEKWAVLKKRRWEKKDAEIRFLEIQESLDSQTIEINPELKKEMEELKKKMVRIKPEDFRKIKALIDAFGFVHYEAPGEADVLCAYLVKSGKAWACLSDDMDMFLYGCPRVLRNLSLLKHHIVLYDTDQILAELALSYSQLLEIAIISGTDYNDGSLSLCKTFELHNEYLLLDNSNTVQEPFQNWIITRANITEINMLEISGFFDINTNQQNSILEIINEKINSDILEKRICIKKIKEIMSEYGFYFP
jgi:5'-3' exonuclease